MLNAPPASTEQERKNLASITEWLDVLDQDASDLSGKVGLTDVEFQKWNAKLEPLKMAAAKRMEEAAGKIRLTEATKLLADNSIDFDLSGVVSMTSTELDMVKEMVRKKAEAAPLVVDEGKTRLAEAKKLIAENASVVDGGIDMGDKTTLTSEELEQIKMVITALKEEKAKTVRFSAAAAAVLAPPKPIDPAAALRLKEVQELDKSFGLNIDFDMMKNTFSEEEVQYVREVCRKKAAALAEKPSSIAAAIPAAEKKPVVEKKAVLGPKGGIAMGGIAKKKKASTIFSSKCKAPLLKTCVELMDLDCPKRKDDMIEALNENVANHGEKVLLRLGGKSELSELCEINEVSASGNKADQIGRLLGM